MSQAEREELTPLARKIRAACALLALMALVTGCGVGSKSTAYPAPLDEGTPSAEVSQNLALALGPDAVDAESIEEKHDKLPRELIGDHANAVYSDQQLTGSDAAPGAASTPALSAPTVPSMPSAPVAAKAPPVMPPVPVEQQATSAAVPAMPPAPAPTLTPAKPTPIAPPAPPAPVANVSDAGRVTVQLAAFRTRANAERGWQRLRAAHPDQLGDRALIMRQIDLGDRGIYYRVRTGPFANVPAAKAFCSLLRARDQDCLVIRLQ